MDEQVATAGSSEGYADAAVNDDGWPPYCNPEYRMPEQIEVRVHVRPEGVEDEMVPEEGDEAETEMRAFLVSVQKAATRKPYLGGYRHTLTGQILHHASSQTDSTMGRRVKDTSRLRTRETQTTEEVTRSAQTTRECGTQMERSGLYLDTKHDRTLRTREYFSAAQLWELKRIKCLFIQRCWRGYLARKNAWARRMTLAARAEEEETARKADEEMKSTKREADIQRRLQPRTTSDFEMLHSELDSWRTTETQRIVEDESLDSPTRQRKLTELLAKETRVLQTIDRMKASAAAEHKMNRTRKMLRFMSQPRQWELRDGNIAEVHTPHTIRAKELVQLYEALGAPPSSIDERLDVLLSLKYTVNEFPCKLTQEIIQLVDRESDLLNRGRKDSSMEGLRRRLCSLFLRFMETPDFNPQAADYVGLPPPDTALVVEAPPQPTSSEVLMSKTWA